MKSKTPTFEELRGLCRMYGVRPSELAGAMNPPITIGMAHHFINAKCWKDGRKRKGDDKARRRYAAATRRVLKARGVAA
jgi:hypothetical protein